MFLINFNHKIINLKVFVTLGDGVVFGELSILNVPGSKVAFLISSHREEKKERGKSSYTFGEDKYRLAGWHQLYSVPLTSWGRERMTASRKKILLMGQYSYPPIGSHQTVNQGRRVKGQT
jgi:hypothetical protein